MDDRSGLEDLNFPPIHSGLTVCTAEVLSRLDFTTVFKGWPIPRSRKYPKKRKWWKLSKDTEMKHKTQLKWVCKIEIGYKHTRTKSFSLLQF